MSAQIAGLEPATRVASRKLGPTSGTRSPLGQVPGRLGDEGVGDRVRHAADRRHQVVVRRGVDRLGTGAEPGDGALQAVVEERRWRCSVGVRYQRAPSKRSARALATPAVSAPASGWPPTKRPSAPSAATMSRLVEPTSVTAASGPRRSSAAAASSGSRPTGAAQKTISAPSTAAATESVAVSAAPVASAASRVAGSGSKPDHLGAEPLPRRQPDRAADQPDAEDGDPRRHGSGPAAAEPLIAAQARRAWTAEANRSSAWTVSSQPRQASVIDWP